MLAGAGRYLGLMVGAILVPFYACFFAAIVFMQHFWVIMSVGMVFMAFSVMGIITLKNAKFTGIRSLGLTWRLPGGKNGFEIIPFASDPVELPKQDGLNCYALTDYLTGGKYVLMLDHPFGDLSYESDEVIVGSWIQKMPVCYVDGVQKREAVIPLSVFERVQPGWVARNLLRREEPATEVKVPMIYLHSTNKTAEKILAGLPLSALPPTKEQLDAAYADFKLLDPELSEKVSLADVRGQIIEKQDGLIEDKAELYIKYSKPQPEQQGMDWKQALKIVGMLAVAGVVVLLFYKLLGMW